MPNRDPAKPRALWNYEFTINTGFSDLSNYTFLLGVDHDASAGTSFSYADPLTAFSDNANGGFATVVQNSENVIFGSTPGGAFSPFAAGLYDFTLSAYDRATGEMLANTSIRVDVVGPAAVPEPASLALLGLGLAGLVASRRRKQVK